ncbi:MAG: phage tail protein, partial [Proteobacteria bacterium]|nr:phage tail protein [Pseudomonadota bacterium]
MTDIPFHQIPSTLREPLFYAELDPSHANTAQPQLRALLIGAMATSGGTATAGTPEIVSSVADAKAKYGAGSILARMVSTYRANDPFGEVWALPIDASAGTAATGNIGFTGPATANGTLALYIAGDLVQTTVTSGMTAAQLATALAASVT